jgi:drug/metabolite transporter (DMT)-like permease
MSRNAALFALLCLVWGLTFLPVRIASAHTSPLLLAAARFVIAGGLLLLWAGRDAGKVPRAAWPRDVRKCRLRPPAAPAAPVLAAGGSRRRRRLQPRQLLPHPAGR